MNLDVSSACFFREPAEQVAEAPAEQRLEVSLRRAMSVQLQEDVVANSWRQIEPAADPRWCGHVVSGDLSGFQAGLQACADPSRRLSIDPINTRHFTSVSFATDRKSVV